VAAGGVRNAATGRQVDWAAFLCEYSHLLPPLTAGTAEWLTGNNTVYDRTLLEEYRAVTHAGKWENHLHDALRRAGVTLVCRPEIVVDHKKHYTFGEYFSQRYLYARSYAGARVAGAQPVRRAVWGLAALALPPLLLWRIVTLARNRPIERWRSVPLLTCPCRLGARAVVGHWFGPGDAWQVT
jgi:hypothetical protein